MTTNEQDGDDHDPVMDWALGERVGGERAPDLIDAVRARLAAAPNAGPAAPARAWLLAAALLGIAVVVVLATWRPEAVVRLAGPQESDGARARSGEEPRRRRAVAGDDPRRRGVRCR